MADKIMINKYKLTTVNFSIFPVIPEHSLEFPSSLIPENYPLDHGYKCDGYYAFSK